MKALLALLLCVAQARFLQPDAVPTAPQLHKPFILDDEGAPENLAAITQILSKEPAAASAVRGDLPALDEVNGVTTNDELLDRVGGLGPLANEPANPAETAAEGEDDDLSGNPELVEKNAQTPEAQALQAEEGGAVESPLAAEAAAAEEGDSFESPGDFAEEQKIKRYQELVDHATQIMSLVPKTKERLAELIKKRDEWRAERIVAAAQKKLNKQTELREEVEAKLEEIKAQQADLEALRERLDKTMAKLQSVITNKGKLVEVSEEERPAAEEEKVEKEDEKAAEETADQAEEKAKEEESDDDDDKDEDEEDKKAEEKEEEKKEEDPEAVTHAVELELSQLKKKRHP